MSPLLSFAVHPEHALLASAGVIALLVCRALAGDGPTVARCASSFSMLLLGFALISAVAVAAAGSIEVKFVQAGPFSLGLNLDALSSSILVLMTLLGAVVTRYSMTYMEGDQRLASFSRWLCATLVSILLVVASGNLVQFAVFWLSTSLCLHRLLTFYPDRKSSHRAAWQKFLISRCSEVCLLLAIIMTWRVFGSFDFKVLFAQAPKLAGSFELQVLCGFLAAAALMRSAQFPFHSWLPETVDCPTPVSALVQAGIIHAGVYLIVRLSPLMAGAPVILHSIAAMGGLTALFASVVMMTQTSSKREIAWSTLSQTGFMMLQCGLGYFVMAVLHLMAHSVYKSYAFLFSGNAISLARRGWKQRGQSAASMSSLAVTLILAVVAGLGAGLVFNVMPRSEPGVVLFALIFLMSVAHLVWTLWSDSSPGKFLVRGPLILGVAAFAFHGFYEGMQFVLSTVVMPGLPDAEGQRAGLPLLIGVLYAAVLIFQSQLPALHNSRWFGRFCVHASHGFYIHQWIERFTNRLLV